jgi:hypothetical protein
MPLPRQRPRKPRIDHAVHRVGKSLNERLMGGAVRRGRRRYGEPAALWSPDMSSRDL